MSTSQDRYECRWQPGGQVDWPRLVERSADAVCRQLAACGELAARQVAGVVVATIPPDIGKWLVKRLAGLGWLEPDARIPFDVLDSPACPPDLHGGRRELVRIAVFGVPGEGQRADAKRREAIYQQRCAEILREMRDLESLSYAAARALGHPEVHGDPVLFGMLRSFVAEREAEIRSRSHLPGSAADGDGPSDGPGSKGGVIKLPLRERVQTALSKLRLELDGHLASYNEDGATEVFKRITDMRRRYPGHVELAVVERCEELLGRLAERRDAFRSQLNELVQRAAQSIEEGDQKTAAWVLRRLSAVHASLPAVLPEDRLNTLRETIMRSGERQERHEAAQRLVNREQAVGAEIKRLSTLIHRCCKRLQGAGNDDAGQAEEDYRRAVAEVRACGDEWLADLMIELDCLLEDLPGSRERAEAQVNKFVSNVQSALRQMQRDIESVQNARSAPSQNG